MADEDTRPEKTPEAQAFVGPMPEVEKKPEAVQPPDLITPAEPHAAPRARPVFVPLLLGGVVAAVLGFGLARMIPGGWPVQDTSALQAEISRQAQEITALRDGIAAAAGPDLSQIEQRLTAIEGAPPNLGDLQTQIDALKAQVSSGTLTPDVQAIVDQTRDALEQTRAQAEALRAEAEEAARATSIAAALTRIAAALDSGTPYGASLDSLTAGGVEVPAALADNASGLPSLTRLQDSFPAAARAGLQASLNADMGATWAERVGAFLRSQTGARSLSPREGTDPDAILSRAEAALAGGDVAGTLEEIGQLPLEGQGAMGDWRAEAERRVAADAALATLTAGAQ